LADCLIQAGVSGPDNLILIAGTSDCILIAETSLGSGGAGPKTKSTAYGVQLTNQKKLKLVGVRFVDTSQLKVPLIERFVTISSLRVNLKRAFEIVGQLKMKRTAQLRYKSNLKLERIIELAIQSKLKIPYNISLESRGIKSNDSVVAMLNYYAEVYNDKDMKIALANLEFTKRTRKGHPAGYLKLRDVLQTTRMNRGDIAKSQTGGVDFKFPMIFRTKEDAKVDCKFCKTFNREEFDMFSPLRPVLPLHPNCRCEWQSKDGGRLIGQF
jgi:hypothetical protein